jgi:alpha-tubulin suppressor-like RCC1 family protein
MGLQPAGPTVTSLSGGMNHTCAIVEGAVKCWGANYYGQLGNATTTARKFPVNVSGLTAGVSTVTTGANYSCAVTAGAAKCWGGKHLRPIG